MKNFLAVILIFSLALSFFTVSAVAEEPHTDELKIEDVQITTDKSGRLNLEVKIRNLYKDTGDKHYPNRLSVSCQFLDENGDALPSKSISISDVVWFDDVDYEQAGWGRPVTLKEEGLPEAKAIRFSGYVIMYNPGHIEWREEGAFSTPYVFLIEDLQNGKGASIQEPTISIENVSIDYAEVLPEYILKSGAYKVNGNAYNKKLAESQLYAVIHFTMTNIGEQDFNVTSKNKAFVVGLDFDEGFIYTTLGPDVSALAAENGDIVVNADTLYGTKVLTPLTTMKYELYLTCPKAVRDQSDKPVTVFFTVGEGESERYEFQLR